MVTIRLPFDGNYQVTQKFGENPEIYSRFGKPGHNGVDFGLPLNTPVLAAAEGTVIKLGYDQNGYGNYVMLQHAGFQTLYAHLTSFAITLNSEIREGDLIGYSGNTGFSTGPHLHFELRIPGFPGAYNKGEVDPLQFIRAVEVPSSGKPGKYVVTASYLNVRLGPSLDAEIIGRLPAGKTVDVTDFEGEWARITAYVHSDYLRQAK